MCWISKRSIGLPVFTVSIVFTVLIGAIETWVAPAFSASLTALLAGVVLTSTSIIAANRVIRLLGKLTDRLEAATHAASQEAAVDDGAEGQSFSENSLPPQVRTLLADVEEAFASNRRDTRARTNFIANMSHELRTPLNSIIGFAEVLREPVFGDLTADQQSYVEDILMSGRHLLSLINDVLDLSKIESGKMELETEQVDLPAIVSGSLRMFREQALKHSIALSDETDTSVRFMEADERKLKQILFNLLSNAMKFTPDGGQISVMTERVDESVLITVRDSGCGIAAEFQERVFESFFQIDTPLTKDLEGTGLGLPLVRQIAELHSGSAWCESEPGQGSRFMVELPLEQSASRSVQLDGRSCAFLEASTAGRN